MDLLDITFVAVSYIYVVCATASHYTTASILDVPMVIVRYVTVFYSFYIPYIIHFGVRRM